MAENQSKIDAAAEKAFAAAAEKTADNAVKTATDGVKAATDAAPAAKADAAPKAAATQDKAAPKSAASKKPAPKKAAAKKTAVRKTVAARKAPAKQPAVRTATRAAAKTTSAPIRQLKDKIMATTTNKTADFTNTAKDAAAGMQTRAKAAYDKGAEMTADMTAFHKGNFDAMIESGKVLAATMQDLGRTAVEDAKTAAETLTADVKKMAAVKSPTELFQLQGEIARRNIDTIVARTSKNAEVMMKLANDMFAPISTRASVAMERVRKAA